MKDAYMEMEKIVQRAGGELETSRGRIFIANMPILSENERRWGIWAIPSGESEAWIFAENGTVIIKGPCGKKRIGNSFRLLMGFIEKLNWIYDGESNAIQENA